MYSRRAAFVRQLPVATPSTVMLAGRHHAAWAALRRRTPHRSSAQVHARAARVRTPNLPAGSSLWAYAVKVLNLELGSACPVRCWGQRSGPGWPLRRRVVLCGCGAHGAGAGAIRRHLCTLGDFVVAVKTGVCVRVKVGGAEPWFAVASAGHGLIKWGQRRMVVALAGEPVGLVVDWAGWGRSRACRGSARSGSSRVVASLR